MEKNNKQEDKTEEVAVTEEAIAPENKPSKPILLWIAIVILLCLFAGASWFMQQQLQKQQRETAELLEHFAATKQFESQLSTLKQTVTKESAMTQQRLMALNTADVSLAEKLDSVTQTQQLTDDEVLSSLAISEISFLLKIANHNLLLAGDTDKAQTALALAEQQLKFVSDPEIDQLRTLLADEQLALASLTQVDVAGLATQLQNALNNIDNLQVLAGPVIAAVESDEARDTTASLPNRWQSAASNAWQEIKSLVVIRHQQDAETALLLPEQRYFLSQNLRLKLESARLALLSNEEAIFQDSLASATRWLQQYYVGEERDTMMSMLETMQSQSITVEMPDISASLNWLQHYGDQQ